MNNDLIKNITDDIIDEVSPEKIILFGSYATGKFSKDSDLDLLIIKQMEKPISRREVLKKIRKRLSKYIVPKDILVYSKDEFDYWKDSINHIIAVSLKEGKILYER